MSFRLEIECAHDERAIPPRGNHENEWGERGDRRPAEPDRAVAGRPPHKAEASAASPRAAARRYMLACAGSQVRFGPIAFWTVVGTLVIMAGWSIVSATYFAFHDEVVTQLIVRQADLQVAYEDRLAEMRAQVDRVTTRQLRDHDQVEQTLSQVLRRQSVLEQRASILGSLGEPGVTGSTKPGARQSPAAETATTTSKPAPTREIAAPKLPGDRHMRRGRQAAAPAASPEVEGKLARLMRSLDQVEQRQAASLLQMEESYETKARRIRSLLAEVGFGPGKGAEAGTGGPYVPVKPPASTDTFERQVHRIQVARAQLDRLHKTLVAVPLRRPVSGEIDMSSGFGTRLDPFVGRPALHTGIDFRGDIGEAVRATGTGTVIGAGWSGGYGRMVEIDHGNGLTTRYGHLSEIVVQVGQTVKIGHVVGRMGSTGRSTGPHLHYETRVDGEAVDPQRFLRAGLRLGSL
jgi:murein DD-endopeptidase MepM/ murein hydrolase activator NlpD